MKKIRIEDRLDKYELIVYRNLRRMDIPKAQAYATILRARNSGKAEKAKRNYAPTQGPADPVQ